jgi:S-(hydroxymethyl)glutathione synthase
LILIWEPSAAEEEKLTMAYQVSIHPALDGGVNKGQANFNGGTLVCACASRPSRSRSRARRPQPRLRLHQMLEAEGRRVLGRRGRRAPTTSPCWKMPTSSQVVDKDALIQRHACRECGVHMYGPVERDHAFKGLVLRPSRTLPATGWPEPTFAAFVSSIIESRHASFGHGRCS